MPEETGIAPTGIVSKSGFLACVGLLIGFAIAFQVLATHRDVQFHQLPLPLKKPLDQLDANQLHPYQLIHRFPPIKPEVLDALGTKEYIQWAFEDTSATTSGPERWVNLFITYYTGSSDQVPHVPEVCYLGSGYRIVETSFLEVPVPALGPDFTIPVQVLEFERSVLLGRESKTVMYTFHANGIFCADRSAVIRVLGNPSNKYAYFSKLELTFGSQEQFPAKDKALEAGGKFLQTIVPRLLKDHWPDWDSAVQGTTSPPAAGQTDRAAAPERRTS